MDFLQFFFCYRWCWFHHFGPDDVIKYGLPNLMTSRGKWSVMNVREIDIESARNIGPRRVTIDD